MATRHSGLQLQVIKLYRQSLVAAKAKPPQYRDNWIRFVRSEFAKNRSVSPKDFNTIEYLVRWGNSRLNTLKNPSIQNISSM
ncbi:hypothetical protein BCR44DRAFT_1426375 [Catenaria anguillulae PL171]|uniref:Complex 1 LYR protein domain-containing protein n=1 Tax=Catenaria anguillulae PL171 TaxID=765915 RepID=A0A1Y2I1R6_9FUNG|nr:hypothetical protein BCR44DRAFT_1426375 [Catenaria anguillulae PL171]